jgi:hypothetical protein
MRNESRHYGPALHDWLENECKAQGYASLGDWATQNKISARNLSGWKTGSTPGPDQLRRVSEAIGHSMVTVLLAAKILLPSDMEGQDLTPTPIMTPRQAIKASSLSQSDKRFMYQALARLESDTGPTKFESD